METEEANQPPAVSMERIRAHGDALNLVRGTVMTCYAQVEFHLADLALRASHLECYDGVVPKFPRRLGDRIKAARQLVEAAGPLAPYREELDRAVDGIREFTDLRDVMGHATAHIDISASHHSVHFEMYDIVKGGKLQLFVQETTIDHLKADAGRLAAYTDTMVSLLRRMRSELPLRNSVDGPIPDH